MEFQAPPGSPPEVALNVVRKVLLGPSVVVAACERSHRRRPVAARVVVGASLGAGRPPASIHSSGMRSSDLSC